MAGKLSSYLTSSYIGAANVLNGKTSRRRIIAYVESYDDVFFWRSVLAQLETPEIFFQVMLPYRNNGKKLERGKKAVLMSALSSRVGQDLIACVDADYDYLKQGCNEMSKTVCDNPYVFHTYAYAIENLQCWAPALHEVCVMATLTDDNRAFDFEDFFSRYSKIIYPLFVWHILSARNAHLVDFSLTDFLNCIGTGKVVKRYVEDTMKRVTEHVSKKLHHFEATSSTKAREAYKALDKELKELGVTPETTYMFIQGHFLFDQIVSPLVENVSKHLIEDREDDIRRQSKHDTQERNEISCYEHSLEEIPSMLKKHTIYISSPYIQQTIADLKILLDTKKSQRASNT